MMSDTEVTRGYHSRLSEQFGPWVFERSHQTDSSQISHCMLTQHPPLPTHAGTHAHPHTHTHTQNEVALEHWQSFRFCISGLNPKCFVCVWSVCWQLLHFMFYKGFFSFDLWPQSSVTLMRGPSRCKWVVCRVTDVCQEPAHVVVNLQRAYRYESKVVWTVKASQGQQV